MSFVVFLEIFSTIQKGVEHPKKIKLKPPLKFAKTTIFLQFSSSDHNSYMEILCDLCKIA